MLWLIVLLGIGYGFLAFRDFRAATFLLICLFPAYLVRLNFGPLPSTALEVAFGIYFVVWLIKFAKEDRIKIIRSLKSNPWFTVAFMAFLAASVISIFTSDMWWFSFGQWRAYFLEPMILFLIIIGRKEVLSRVFLTTTLLFSTFSITIFGIFQKLSGYNLPSDGRATSFFSSPNAVGLYLGPIVLLSCYLLINKKHNFQKLLLLLILSLCLLTIFFTKSFGTIIAICCGFLILLWLSNYRKIAIMLSFILIISGALISPFSNFITSKNQSSANRLLLWQYSTEYLTSSSQNFIFGTGIRQFFRKIQKPHYDVKQLERLIYPHNIFLNFWTETGLLGVLSFVLLFGLLIKFSIQIYSRDRKFGACLVAAFAVLLIHGQIDVPYFKNDLAMLFWLIAALTINNVEV